MLHFPIRIVESTGTAGHYVPPDRISLRVGEDRGLEYVIAPAGKPWFSIGSGRIMETIAHTDTLPNPGYVSATVSWDIEV